MKILLGCVFFPCLLVATIWTPFSLKLRTGYRQDYIQRKVSLTETLWTKEVVPHLPLLYIEAEGELIYRDIYFCVQGGWGGLGKGKSKIYPLDSLSYFDLSSCYSFTEAQTYNLEAALGMCANLTPERHYQVVLIPHLGYQGLLEFLSPSIYLDVPSSTTVLSILREKTKLTWQGIFLGAILWFSLRGPFTGKLGYSYHWLDLHQQWKQQQTLFEIEEWTPIEAWVLFSPKSQKGQGHSVKLELVYKFPKSWAFSFLGKTSYFSSSKRELPVYSAIKQWILLGLVQLSKEF